MVLPLVTVKALEKVAVDADLIRRAAGSAEVHDPGGGREPDSPPTVPQAPLPIGLLLVHEEALVEAADRRIRFAPDEKAGPADPVNIALFVVPPPAEIPPGRPRWQKRRDP